MTIKTDMLRYFVAVAEAGNLSKAAEKLQRSPAAISMMLKQFEEELGSPLFETDRKSHLTALGEFTLAEARRELMHFENSISAILKFAESGEGQVRVAAMPSAAANLLPQTVRELHIQNPNILVDIEDMTNDAILDKVNLEVADIGIVNHFLMRGAPHMQSVHVLSDRMGILCGRNSFLGRKEKIYWSDLATEPFISHELCRTIDEPALRKAAAQSKISASSALAIQSFVRGGNYVSPIPELGGLALPSDVVFRVPEGNAYWRNVYLVWNEHNNLSPATKRFCRLLKGTISELGMQPRSANGEILPFKDVPT